MLQTQTRRRFLTMTALAGAAGLLSPQRGWADEPALETTTVRFGKLPVICFAPQYICEALLRAEGFTDVGYVNTTPATADEDLGSGKLDFQSHLSLDHAMAIDRGLPITIVTGVHAGCYELFAHGGIRSIGDLKGKRIGAESILLSMSGSIRRGTSTWSTIAPPNLWSYSPRASSTRIWRFRPKTRNCTRARSAM
jgi:NitT/TauT family transport system substrate-binding protein